MVGSVISRFFSQVRININIFQPKAPGGVPNAGAGKADLVQYQKMKGQLLGEEVSQGHAFDKHVLQEGQFKEIDIRTRAQFAEHAESVFSSPSEIRYYTDGRTVYLQESTGTVLIKNPVSGESTMFQPDHWDAYLQKLPSRTTPYSGGN